jgi:hypothetical protein
MVFPQTNSRFFCNLAPRTFRVDGLLPYGANQALSHMLDLFLWCRRSAPRLPHSRAAAVTCLRPLLLLGFLPLLLLLFLLQLLQHLLGLQKCLL